jgi:hypothetical protein
MYFSKEDEKSLRKLLQKVKGQADGQCATAGAHSAKEEAALNGIVGKYKLSKADVEGARTFCPLLCSATHAWEARQRGSVERRARLPQCIAVESPTLMP